ncbi:MAG: bifunctional transaldolase/phosoglucose isomerase [Deltaproteobacteria bacterium]|nr:bifunctional transaldolase/phosoglucose isomerase [Deltaproteobacteria bacterium]
MANPLKLIRSFGQSIWYDNLSRELLHTGMLKKLIDEDGVVGVTSNPTILLKAISSEKIYDDDIHAEVDKGAKAESVYESLTVSDIREAADLLEPVFRATTGLDGYVSLEVAPSLAYERSKTVAEAKRLFTLVDRPNVMIKVPATSQGIDATRELISSGVNINATLIFSIEQYEAVAEAYISGIEKWIESGGDPQVVASVASFFVSRVDTAVDERLHEFSGPANRSACRDLLGTAAIANANLAYQYYRQILESERWKNLQKHGAAPQRVLWASTSTKDPSYPDTYYVDNLLWPDTVNTLPTATLDAYRDHGSPDKRSQPDPERAKEVFKALEGEGLNLDLIMRRLLEAGVNAFADSFDKLISEIASKRTRLLRGYGHRSASLGDLHKPISQTLARFDEEKITQRIWDMRSELWTQDAAGQAEIAQRLGWLRVVETMTAEIEKLKAFAHDIASSGFKHVALIGMGGSSLAPEVFMECFGKAEGYPELKVLDTTVPDTILAIEHSMDLSRTLFIVSSKSGGTIEVMSLFKYFYDRVKAVVGESVGSHFIAITDPGTSLGKLAADRKFRKTFLNPSDIGGRFSALSYFGLVPAALIGADIGFLLARADQAVEASGPDAASLESPGAWLGVIIGEAALAGRDKLTLVVSPCLRSFAYWLEQLIAESLGKNGKGVIPIESEPLGRPDSYGQDRVFVYLRLDSDPTHDIEVSELERAGQPVVTLRMHNAYDIGREMFRWEFATAVAGKILGVNPFDQPNVQESKDITGSTLKSYASEGKLPEVESLIVETDEFPARMRDFLSKARHGDYVAFNAFIQPSQANRAELEILRTFVRDKLKVATTVGFGPRYLHSTGQIHKGGANTGLFILITSDDFEDFPVPGANYSFGTLKSAQAIGDFEALKKRDRRAIHVHMKDESQLGEILEALR